MVVLAAAALAGCTGTAGTATEHDRSRSSATPSVVAVPHDAVPSATAGNDVAEAAHTAGAALRAFCQPRRSPSAWIAGLDPWLTMSAAAVYATVDPARVPCSRVTDAGHAAAGDAFTRVVVIPTDAGRYRVTVSRQSTTAPWLASQLVPMVAR